MIGMMSHALHGWLWINPATSCIHHRLVLILLVPQICPGFAVPKNFTQSALHLQQLEFLQQPLASHKPLSPQQQSTAALQQQYCTELC